MALDPIPNTPGRQEIVDLYANALAHLKDILLGFDATKAGRRRAAEKIIEIEKHIKYLKRKNAIWAERYIPKAYKNGFHQDRELLKRFLGNKYTAKFSRLHQNAAMVAAEAVTRDFRLVADALEQSYVGFIEFSQFTGNRQRIAAQIGGGIIEGQARTTVSKNIMDTLSSNVIQGKITVGKATMNAKSYADLLARTLSRAARTEGTVNRLKQDGIDLVIISDTGAVDFCRIYENQIFSLSGRSKRFPKLTFRPPYHPNCYDKETEVYTTEGWKNISNVKTNELCLSLNPETKNVEYVPVINTVSHKSEKMVSVKNRGFDLLVTPDHQMFYMTEHHYKHGKNQFKFIDANKLIGKNSGVFYRSSEWKSDKLKGFIKLGSKQTSLSFYAEFMAWYLSDGSVTEKCNQVCIAQEKEKSPKTYERIHDLLHNIGYVNHSHGKYGFVIQDKKLTKQLLEYGKSHEKFIPIIIKDADPVLIRIFLNTYVMADGHRRKSKEWKGGKFRGEMVYFTTSKRLADDLGELILKASNRPSFSIQKSKGKTINHKNGTYKGNYDLWVIRECYSQYATLKNMVIKTIDYNDMTYCVELEKYHTLWVRRNGKTCWSGNCTHTLSAFIAEYADEGEERIGSQFLDSDVNKSAKEMSKKYPIIRDDTRSRTKRTQKAA